MRISRNEARQRSKLTPDASPESGESWHASDSAKRRKNPGFFTIFSHRQS